MQVAARYLGPRRCISTECDHSVGTTWLTLAVMTANDDPPGVRSASVSGTDAVGRPFGFRQYAKLAFAIQPHSKCRPYYSGLSRGDSGVSGRIVKSQQ